MYVKSITAPLLPSTGGDQVLLIATIVTTVIGLAIVLSTVARLVAKKAIKPNLSTTYENERLRPLALVERLQP